MDTDPGLYFSWGNSIGFEAGSDENFSEIDYADTPGAEISTNIDIEHDAARLTLGGNWRMPTKEDYQELMEETNNRWTMKNGVYGMIFSSKVTGQSIFIPAAGRWIGSDIIEINSHARLWSSTFYDMANAWYANIKTLSVPHGIQRFSGLPIRAVRDD